MHIYIHIYIHIHKKQARTLGKRAEATVEEQKEILWYLKIFTYFFPKFPAEPWLGNTGLEGLRKITRQHNRKLLTTK